MNFKSKYYFLSLVINLLSIIKICSSQVILHPVAINESAFVPRVVSGWPAKLGDVPYQIGFKQMIKRSRRLYTTFCGGTIVSSTKLISAAHCFQVRKSSCFTRSITVSGKALANKVAVAGNLMNKATYKAGKGDGQWRRLRKVMYPAKYKFPIHDICIVMTSLPFYFDSNVAPIPYAIRYADYQGSCTVSGYGRTSEKNKRGSDVLLIAHLELLPRYWCSRVHRRNMKNFICTSDKVADVGKGDSGGPLVCMGTGDPNDRGKGVLVGVVSGNRRRVGSFFTRVSSYSRYVSRNNAETILFFNLYSTVTLLTIYYGFYLFCCL